MSQPLTPSTHAATRWLLLRGLGRERRHWGDFPQDLEAALHAPVDMLDLPGFGIELGTPSPRSMSAIALDLRRRWQVIAGPQPVSLVGISLGGMAALEWARLFPADVARVVVINSSAANLAWPWERFLPRTVWPMLAARGRSHRMREYVLINATTHLTRRRIRQLARARARQSWVDPPGHALVRQLWAAFTFRARPIVPPTLVLASNGDRLVRPTCSRRLADLLLAPLRTHPTAGHDLPLDDPAWVVEQIAAWQKEPAA